MASISTDDKGNRRIIFALGNGLRRSVRIGKPTMKDAERIRLHIESLVSAHDHNTPVDPATAEWVRGLSDKALARLVRVGLCKPRNQAIPTLGGLLEFYFGALNVKPGTKAAYMQARTSLEKYFGVARLLSTIGPIEAETWAKSLRDKELSPATQSKRIRTAKGIFHKATRWKLVAENPFLDVKGGSKVNRERMVFVSREDIAKAISAAPDAEWRCIIALARYAGVRVPSELLSLKWTDVDWAAKRLCVRSPKTEHHEGHESRFVPIFPEIAVALRDAYEAAADGNIYVIHTYRLPNTNLRTQFKRILENAGVSVWPKLFQNLRSSRETELSAKYPIADVTAWMGNSPSVAAKHYLQSLDANFASATEHATGPIFDTQLDNKKATRKAARHTPESTRSDAHDAKDAFEQDESSHVLTESCGNLRDKSWGQQDSNLRPHRL
jgi:integrase